MGIVSRPVEHFPCELITRCHVTPSSDPCITYPTVRAVYPSPKIAAIWPYVITRPLGILRTTSNTRSRYCLSLTFIKQKAEDTSSSECAPDQCEVHFLPVEFLP